MGIVDGFFIIVIFLLLGAGAQWVFNGVTGEGRDDSDKSSWNHSGVDVITDAKTGLEYLSHGSALTPRLDADGNQIREKIQ